MIVFRRLSALVAAACARGRAPAAGQAVDAPAFTIRLSLKSSALLTRAPDDPLLFPDRETATGFWRFRLEPSAAISDSVGVDVAVEQRLRLFSSPQTTVGAGVLPSDASAPFRVRALDWRVASGANAEWRAEIDRAAVHAQIARATVTVGRQAIGWGRGVLFGAVDLFAPFTPLEADREWRRGVDAVRADVKLTNRTSFDVVGAFGPTIGASAFAARLRGYARQVDLELVAGRRAEDPFAGVTSSVAVGDVEIHGEAARFGGVMKALAGGSYQFPIGNGLLVYAEYHYSGYGAPTPDAIVRQLQDPAFQLRYLRGDTQILGRHAIGVLASYEWSPELSGSGEWLQSPADGSGVAVPSLTFTTSDRWSMVISGYVPFGRQPAGATLGSEFGASPLALFVQLKWYR
ncbi:MAG: hypothetical protein ACHQO8_07545 [Vicinamibacterales bacterium]